MSYIGKMQSVSFDTFTITFGIHYAIDSTLDLIGFIDLTGLAIRIDHKSTSGYSSQSWF
jgi:hypothetical protein